MILAQFRWYRRLRGGYWAQVTGWLWGQNWVRCSERDQPTPDKVWEFYPWASKTLGNGYIDEWYAQEPHFAVALSSLPEVKEAMKRREVSTPVPPPGWENNS